MVALLVSFLLAIQPLSTVSVTCGVRDAQTPKLRSSAGFTAVLKMHSEDDHAKNSHECEASYTLQATRPDGTVLAPFDLGSSIDAWDRPITIRIEGFTPDGHAVFAFISENEHPESIEAVQFDMSTGRKLKDVLLDSHFTRRLSPVCAATLHIVGLSPAALMVLGSSQKDGCDVSRLWELAPNKTTEPTGGRVLPEYPRILSSAHGVIALDPGQSVRP